MFDHPAVVIIGGIWKSGKTDFALYIAETLIKLSIIHEVASNIDTKGTFPMITDLTSLRSWLYSNNKRKLYIFDEANIHLPGRRAMSTKNVEIIRLFGEVSKAHARLIFIGQNIYRLDKELLDETWTRGLFIKRNLKTAQLISHLLPKTQIFRNVPPCSISFDPYAVAPFEPSKIDTPFKEDDLNTMWQYANGSTFISLGFKHSNEWNRFLRKNLRYILDKLKV